MENAAYSESMQRLIGELARLPGIGRKTAARLAYFIIKCEDDYPERLAGAIRDARENLRYCSVCCNITETDPCGICSDASRDHGVICVVEQARDVIAVERTGQYRGVYHVLGGALSPMEGIRAEDLKIAELVRRINGDVREVIMATSLGVEGETTAMYLARVLSPLGVKVTRIARGLPSGAELEYTDEATLANAIEGRREI